MTDRLATILASLGDRWPVVTGPGWAVVHGDCLDVLPCVPAGSVAHLVSDPPYGEHTHTNHRVGATTAYRRVSASPSRAKEIGFDPLSPETMRSISDHASRVVGRWSLVFCEIEQGKAWQIEFERSGLDYVRTGAWVKPGSTPQFSGDRPAVGFEAIVIAHRKGRKRWNGGGKHGLWTVPIVKPQCGTRLHATQKPVGLMEELVKDFTDPGDLVLDAFAGSATTGIACLRLGRQFIGIERDPAYFEIACRRMRGDEAKPRPEQPSIFDLIPAATARAKETP